MQPGWTNPADLKEQLERVWQRGILFSSLVSGESLFPLRLRLKGPSTQELSEHFSDVRKWISDLRQLTNFRVNMRDFKHRTLGRNQIPDSIWIDSIDDAAVILGRKDDLECFKSIIDITRSELPTAINWLTEKPMLALFHAADWRAILRVVQWMQNNPRPNIFAREVSIAGVHSKFIDDHKQILSEMFDEILPKEAIVWTAQGLSQFNKRYGFKDKPTRIRFRSLDQPEKDQTLDSASFALLKNKLKRIFIVENEINFLAFPAIIESMVIFGSGYGFESLAHARWLFDCHIYYWGDIDTHGFAILNSLRKYFPHVKSLLMDEVTLLRFKSFSGTESEPNKIEFLNYLDESEAGVYSALKRNDWSEKFRLEQEHIDWSYVTEIISAAIASEPPQDGKQYILSTHDIYDYQSPSRCELRVHLLSTENPEQNARAPLTPFSKEKERFLSQYLTSLGPDINNQSNTPTALKTLATLEAIARRDKFIYKPFLCTKLRLAGRNIEFHASADFLVLDGESYVIRNISLARQVDDVLNSHLRLAGQMFSLLLGHLVPTIAHRTEVMIGYNAFLAQPEDSGLEVLRCLVEILAAKTSQTSPFSPVGWSKCYNCKFRSSCFGRAVQTQDVAILPAVNQVLAKKLHFAGVKSITQLISKFDDASLSDFIATKSLREKEKFDTSHTARTVLREAAAFKDSTYIWLDRSALSGLRIDEKYAIFDCEGLPPFLSFSETTYLWGLKFFDTHGAPQYIPSMAVNREHDRDTWEAFLSHCRELYETHGDIQTFHWHHYERTMLRKYVDKYGDVNATAQRIQNNLIDLHELVRSSVVLPTLSYGLKTIETFIGYHRRLAKRDGAWAIEQYLDMLAEESDSKRKSIQEELQSYNEEDLDAVDAVMKWLIKHQD